MGTRGVYGRYLGGHRYGHLPSYSGGVQNAIWDVRSAHQRHQSCREELEGGRVNDISAARETIGKLWAGVEESSRDVEIWGGEFPFDKAANSIEFWRV